MWRPSSLVIEWHRILVNPQDSLKSTHQYTLVHLLVVVADYWWIKGDDIVFLIKIFFTIILIIFHTVKFLYFHKVKFLCFYKLSLDWFLEILLLIPLPSPIVHCTPWKYSTSWKFSRLFISSERIEIFKLNFAALIHVSKVGIFIFKNVNNCVCENYNYSLLRIIYKFIDILWISNLHWGYIW